jgi:hypothetical protein
MLSEKIVGTHTFKTVVGQLPPEQENDFKNGWPVGEHHRNANENRLNCFSEISGNG